MPKSKKQLDMKTMEKELLRVRQDLQSGKKRIRVPWWLVPAEALTEMANFGIDATKGKWTITVDSKGEHHYGVAS